MKSFLHDHPWAFEEAVRMAGRVGDEAAFARELEDAMWAGDCDRLHELAGCQCCCWEHTFEGCPARVWDGCRGSGSMTRAELEHGSTVCRATSSNPQPKALCCGARANARPS